MNSHTHVILSVETWLARHGWTRCIMIPPAIEAFTRSGAWLVSLCTGRARFGIERRLRGFLSAPRFGAVGLRMDRRLQIESPAHLTLGNDVTLYGGSHFVSGESGRISIGDRTHIGRNCVLSGLGEIKIGEGCAISSSVDIFSVSNHFRDSPCGPILDQVEHAPVTIGNDVWIGTGAKILPGVRIDDHAVVGAGAVVNRDVEPWKVAVGAPARIVKDRRDRQSSRAKRAA